MRRLYYRGAVRGVRSLGEVSKVYLFSLSGNLSRCVSRLPPRQCSEPGCRALRGAQPPCRRCDRCGHPSAITTPDTAADGPAHCPLNHTTNALPFTITPTRQPTPLPTNQPSPSPSTLTVPDPHGPALSLAHHAALVPGVTPCQPPSLQGYGRQLRRLRCGQGRWQYGDWRRRQCRQGRGQDRGQVRRLLCRQDRGGQ